MIKKNATMLVFLVTALFLATPNSAHASAVYSVHLKKKLNGAKIFAETNKVNAPGSLTILKLSNFDSRDVECKASFDPRIEQKKSYKRRLKANTSISIRYTTARTPNRMNINLVCRPFKETSSNKD